MKLSLFLTLSFSLFITLCIAQKRINYSFNTAHGSIYSPQKNSLEDHIEKESAYYLSSDTLSSTKWLTTDTGKSLIASGALIGLGLYTYKDSGFLNRVTTKEQINRYLPGFENHLDDHLQYIPYLGIYVLDWAGIPSKHNTKRKTTTVATSLLLNLIVVQGLKYSIAETRPDGSANNSFPSGHTTTAFMGAHIFHKEYGERSPYYSIGAYIMASVTGFFRQLNDRHWSSDVLVGAGLGISLTELAYYLNGLYYGEEGINDVVYNPSDLNVNKPSFLEAKASYANLINEVDQHEFGLIAKNGFALDIEGAYFFNKYLGLGGNLGIQSFPVGVDDVIKNEFEILGFDINSESVGNSKYSLGPYVQYPFGKNTIGGKFLMGYSTISDTEIRLSPIDGDITEIDDITYAQFSPKGGFIWSTGIYFKRLLSERLYMGVYADYNNLGTDLEVRVLEDININDPIYTERTFSSSFHSYNIGANIGVMLW
jgi:hypothetical protein